MRIFFGIFLIVLCTFIGYFFSSKYVSRKDFYIAFSDFNKKLIGEVMFLSETINSIISKEKGSIFIDNLKNVLINKKEYEKIKYLSDDENEFFKEYINVIGKNDRKTETAILRDYEISIDKSREEAVKSAEKYKKTYIKIGFLIGLMLMIAIL